MGAGLSWRLACRSGDLQLHLLLLRGFEVQGQHPSLFWRLFFLGQGVLAGPSNEAGGGFAHAIRAVRCTSWPLLSRNVRSGTAPSKLPAALVPWVRVLHLADFSFLFCVCRHFPLERCSIFTWLLLTSSSCIAIAGAVWCCFFMSRLS